MKTFWRAGIAAVLLGVAGVSGFLVWQHWAAAERPNILMITLDDLRADHLGCYGYGRPTSPTLDALAGKGALFTDAISASVHTSSSNASLITSAYPNRHGVKGFGDALSPQISKTLPELLKEHGYRTAFISDQLALTQVKGFERGYDTFNTVYAMAMWQPHHRRLVDVTDWAVRWLEAQGHQKFFLWLYYLSPHGPYDPPPAYSRAFLSDKFYEPGPKVPFSKDPFSQSLAAPIPRYLMLEQGRDVGYYIAQYDGEIRRVDDGIKRVLETLKKNHLDHNTLIIINADHGEALGEHQRYFCHASSLFDEEVRVPLIMNWEKKIPSGTRIGRQVRSIDLMPTLLDIAGIPWNDMQGQSLWPLIQGRPGSLPQPAYSQWDPWVSVRFQGWKLILHRGRMQYELYNLKDDPKELDDRVGKDPDVFKALSLKLDQYLLDPKAAKGQNREGVDPEAKEKLRALGYAQ